MDVDPSIHPAITKTDYSPPGESLTQALFDQAYHAEMHAILPGQSLDNFFDDTFVDDSYFDCFSPSIEHLVSLDHVSGLQPAPPSDQLELKFTSSVDATPILHPNVPVTSDTTRSSLRSPRDKDALATPPSSPSSPMCETTDSSTSSAAKPILKRRRCRSRINCKLSGSIEIPSPTRLRRTPCVPHNQVERKYRNGLNLELERLRRVVPALSQTDNGDVMGRPRPTKAMVLSCATEYISKIKLEKDELRRIYEQLRRRCEGK